MRFVTSLIGLLAALVMLGVSGAMNYLFLSSLGKTPLEGQLLGAASAAADGLKALLPFFIVWAWRARRFSVAFPGLIAWVFFSGFSLLSAIGFAAANRGAIIQTRDSQSIALEITRTELKAANIKLATIPAHRVAAIVREEIERQKQNRRWSSTSGCKDATATQSRTFCSNYYSLRAERAASIEAQRLTVIISELKTKAEGLQKSGAGQDADPQVSFLARVFALGEGRVRLVLIIVVAFLVEIGSSLGLYLSTNHSEMFKRKAKRRKPRVAKQKKAPPTGQIEDYCLQRLSSAEGNDLTLAQLFKGYQEWCRDKETAALKKEDFAKEFGKLAGNVGLSRHNGRIGGIAFIKL